MAATDPDASELNAEQLRGLLEEEAQRYLGMSAEQFIAGAERGELPDHPVVGHLSCSWPVREFANNNEPPGGPGGKGRPTPPDGTAQPSPSILGGSSETIGETHGGPPKVVVPCNFGCD